MPQPPERPNDFTRQIDSFLRSTARGLKPTRPATTCPRCGSNDVAVHYTIRPVGWLLITVGALLAIMLIGIPLIIIGAMQRDPDHTCMKCRHHF
jgi:hypothetical protein